MRKRRPDGLVGMALVLPALTDCRWFESLLVSREFQVRPAARPRAPIKKKKRIWEKIQKFGKRMYSVLNHLEPTWTSLKLSWNNAHACEQVGNHFKFVGTDLWTIEPIGSYRTQVGTNLEPNGTTREASTPSPKIILVSGAENEPKKLGLATRWLPHQVSPPRLGSATF